jgi:hypothetical protein
MRPARQAPSGRTPSASASTRRPAVECDLNKTNAGSRRCLRREDRADGGGGGRVDVGHIVGEGSDFDAHPSADANAIALRGWTRARGDKACLYDAVEPGLCANAGDRRDSRMNQATACVTACPIMSGRAGSRGALPTHADGLGGDGAPLAR